MNTKNVRPLTSAGVTSGSGDTHRSVGVMGVFIVKYNK